MIEVKDLKKTYDRRTRAANTVLHGVSLSLPDRGFVCILGPSGCGKTSFLNAVGGLDSFDGGSLTVDGLTVTKYGTRAFELVRDRSFGYIFQNYYLLPEHSVAYNVYLGLHGVDLPHAEKIKRVKLALKSVGMERYIRRRVDELSGGQQQRVAIARAIVKKPRVIFADEPTGNLDEESTRAVCTLLRRASKESLVVMVTHEEDIARFFADRIIRLSDGRVVSDSESWERADMAASSQNRVYAGELEESSVAEGSLSLRILSEKGAEPVELTVAVLRNRVLLKISDRRAVTLGKPEDAPVIVEGKRPVIDIDAIDSGAKTEGGLFGVENAPSAAPGSGLTARMMFREAWSLRNGGKMRKAGTRVFLVLLTVLVLVVVGDFLNLAKVDPEDFLTSDPHMLSVNIAQGSKPSGVGETHEADFTKALSAAAKSEGLDFDIIQPITAKCEYKVTTFFQMDAQTVRLPNAMSYAPIDRLDESALIYGTMPIEPYEIVVDRQVLEAMLEQDSLVLNSVRDLSYFIGAYAEAVRREYPLKICGISDSGARTAYLSKSAMLALCNGSAKILSLSELKRMFPGEYDGLGLKPEECLVNTATVGKIWEGRIGEYYRPGGSGGNYTVAGTVSIDDTHYSLVLSDEAIDIRAMNLAGTNYEIYCADKPAMLSFVRKFIKSYDDAAIIPSVTDRYGIQLKEYEDAAHIRMDARSIVTASVLVLCVVMLYLLCRTQARERIGLVAVYRMLGIPGRKLYAIFLIEGAVSALAAMIPAAALTWAAVAAIQRWSSVELPLLLPWYAAALSGLVIVVCYLAVTVIPLSALLRLPPAKLAARYE